MRLLTLHFSLPFLLLVGLSGCGGGGGTPATTPSTVATPSVVSTAFFPFREAFGALLVNGMDKTFQVVSGTCTGGGADKRTPVSTGPSATIEGFKDWPTVRTFTSGCSVASIPTTETTYYADNNDPHNVNLFDPIASSGATGNYGVYEYQLNASSWIPNYVSSGDTGPVGTVRLYTDSKKATGAGRVDVTYIIERDTAVTVIANLVLKTYNAAGTLILTEQSRYRLAEKNIATLVTPPLVPLSVDILDAITTKLWVLTYN